MNTNTDPAERILVVNADDFGRTRAINEGVAEAFERGIVTSASLMTRWPASKAASAYARVHPALSVGLHLDLGEWTYTDGDWVPRYTTVSAEDRSAVTNELHRQLTRFEELVGRLPSHLDSHQHIHRNESVRGVVLDAGRMLGIPVRHYTKGISYCGDFYGQSKTGAPLPGATSAEALIEIMRGLPAGVTELCCHPAVDGEPELGYGAERVVELKSLCDPRVRDGLQAGGIELRSFRQVTVTSSVS